jgi:hypothetical protein
VSGPADTAAGGAQPPAAQQVLAHALEVAERRAVALLLHHPRAAAGVAAWPFGVLEDHRVEVLGDLADALDALIPGAGAQLMRVVYPELPRLDDADERALDYRLETALAVSRAVAADQADQPADPATPPRRLQ